MRVATEGSTGASFVRSVLSRKAAGMFEPPVVTGGGGARQGWIEVVGRGWIEVDVWVRHCPDGGDSVDDSSIAEPVPGSVRVVFEDIDVKFQ